MWKLQAPVPPWRRGSIPQSSRNTLSTGLGQALPIQLPRDGFLPPLHGGNQGSSRFPGCKPTWQDAELPRRGGRAAHYTMCAAQLQRDLRMVSEVSRISVVRPLSGLMDLPGYGVQPQSLKHDSTSSRRRGIQAGVTSYQNGGIRRELCSVQFPKSPARQKEACRSPARALQHAWTAQ